MGEDGPEGLSGASRLALSAAHIIMAPPRHLALLGTDFPAARRIVWPVPYAHGIAQLAELRGQNVVVLASNDPFWFGAGSVLATHFERHEWRVFSAPSTFSRAASALGWPLERTLCLGLHAAPLSRMRPHLAPKVRLIALLRGGDSARDLARYLCDLGFGSSTLWFMESLGGPDQRITEQRADAAFERVFSHPLCAAIEVAGDGPSVPRCSGLADSFFQSDGVMSKRAVRALTLSALAPKPAELLWDIGGGSGTVASEWLLSAPTTQALTIEPRPDRIAFIRANASALGVEERLSIIEGVAPQVLGGLARPDAVFIGGGMSAALLDWLEAHLPSAVRLVANAVTLEGEALLSAAQSRIGGTLLRVDVSEAKALGSKRGWGASYPIVQWSAVL